MFIWRKRKEIMIDEEMMMMENDEEKKEGRQKEEDEEVKVEWVVFAEHHFSFPLFFLFFYSPFSLHSLFLSLLLFSLQSSSLVLLLFSSFSSFSFIEGRKMDDILDLINEAQAEDDEQVAPDESVNKWVRDHLEEFRTWKD